MNYYKKPDGSVIATIGAMNYPEISKEEFDTVMQKAEENTENYPPTPTLDERVTNVENELSEIQTAYREGVNDA